MPVSPKHKISIPDKLPAWGPNDSLGVKLERAFTRFVQDAFTWAVDAIVDLLEVAADRAFKILAPGMRRTFDPLLKYIEDEPLFPKVYKDFVAKVREERGEFEVIAGTVAVAPIVIGILTGIAAPVLRLAEHKVDQLARSGLVEPFLLLEMLRRKGMSPENVQKFLSLASVPDEIIEGYKTVSVNLLSLGDAVGAWQRKEYTDAEFEEYLRKLGYGDKDVSTIKVTAFQQPGIGDLISMLVRDVFNESVVGRYGYDEDYPAQVEELARKIGLAPEWPKRYWRAHWNLPSPTQGAEMVHRAGLPVEDYKTLLRIADYPPFWRNYFEKIIFSPFTRVDIRRMYGVGTLTAGEVFAAYKEIGYDDFHAQKLAEFTFLQVTETDRELTRGDILGAFQDGIYTEDAARTAILRIGYDEAETTLLLARVKKDLATAIQKEVEAQAKAAFTNRQIEESQAIADLSAAGIGEAKVKRLITEWRRLRDARTAKPTKAEMRGWFQDGIVTQSDYEDFLKMAGYADEIIDFYMAEAQAGGAAVEVVTLTQAQVLSAFIADTLTESEASARLADLGLVADEVTILIERAQASKDEKTKREVKALVRLQFINQQVDAAAARSALNVAGVSLAEQDALLAEWQRTRTARIEQQARDTQKELSKSDALALFKRGQLSEAETLSSLTVAGYSAEAASLLIAGARADLIEQAADTAIDLARVRFLNDLIDVETARAALAAGGLSAADVEARLLEWQRARELRAERLTQAQALRLLLDRIISLAGYVEYLKLLGFAGEELANLTAQAQLRLGEGE